MVFIHIIKGAITDFIPIVRACKFALISAGWFAFILVTLCKSLTIKVILKYYHCCLIGKNEFLLAWLKQQAGDCQFLLLIFAQFRLLSNYNH